MLAKCSNTTGLLLSNGFSHNKLSSYGSTLNCLDNHDNTVSSLLHPLFSGQNWKNPHLVQRDHGIGHGEDEVDVVLRHLLCDQSQRWVILWRQSRRCGSCGLTSALASYTPPARFALRSCISLRCSPTVKFPRYIHTYHCCRLAVHVVRAEVALSIVWLHDPSQTTV